MSKNVSFRKCDGCGKLMIFQGAYPQPHECIKVIDEVRTWVKCDG